MKFQMDPTLFEIVPNLKIGINHYTKTTVAESPQMVKGRLQLFQEQLFFELEETPAAEFPGIKEWRAVWKSFGASTSRHRHSTEALMRRIAKQNYLKSIDSAVDLNNFFSLQYQIPVGIYDADKINDNIKLILGNNETSYEGLNGRFNTLANIPALSDDIGAFGSPYVDSARTAVTEATTNIIQVFFLRPSLDATDSLELITAAGKMFTGVSGGNPHSYILNNEKVSININ